VCVCLRIDLVIFHFSSVVGERARCSFYNVSVIAGVGRRAPVNGMQGGEGREGRLDMGGR